MRTHHITTGLLVVALLPVASTSAGDRTSRSITPPSTPGHLQIHQINVEQGNCCFIIGPDGTTLLIDGGSPGKGAAEIVPYLMQIGVLPAGGLDYMLATHHHADHLGGLDEVILAGYDVRRAVWDNGSDMITDQVLEFFDAASLTSAGGVQPAPLGAGIDLGGGATAQIVAAGGEVLGYGPVSGASANENDLSVSVLVQLQDFDLLIGGDTGGGEWSDDRTCTGRTTGQVNVESPLATSLMPGGGATLLTQAGLEVLVVNHHGSESSTNSEYMNQLTPTVAVIPVGAGQGSNYNHPRKDVVENVLLGAGPCITALPAFVVQTEEGNPIGSRTSLAGYCVGDVIVDTTGSGTFLLQATGAVSQGPDERGAAGLLGQGVVFPLDSSPPPGPHTLVINEIMQNPADVPDSAGEWFELYNPGTDDLDIDGWTIRDDDVDLHVIHNGSPLIVPAGGYAVLGRSGDPSANGGYLPDYVYSDFLLANAADEVILVDSTGTVVDAVRYTGASPWPDPTGKSMELRDASHDNADPSNWAEAISRGGRYDSGGTDLGTPGATNSILP